MPRSPTVAKPIQLVRDTRPMPPEMAPGMFVPGEELASWVRRTFIDDDGVLANPTHAHLSAAEIGFLWTTVDNVRAGRIILGQCEVGTPRAMGKWAKARAEIQIEGWFGCIPDFIITLSAPWCAWADDASFCALIEHELSHAAQALDDFGQPKFNRQTGLPVFAVKGHDVEEFVGVVARYGAAATGVEEMVRAANAGPTIGEARIAMACGTCERKRA